MLIINHRPRKSLIILFGLSFQTAPGQTHKAVAQNDTKPFGFILTTQSHVSHLYLSMLSKCLNSYLKTLRCVHHSALVCGLLTYRFTAHVFIVALV